MGNSPNVKPTEQKHQTYVDYEPGVYQENRKTIPIMFKWPYNGRKGKKKKKKLNSNFNFFF